MICHYQFPNMSEWLGCMIFHVLIFELSNANAPPVSRGVSMSLIFISISVMSLRWRHNEWDGVSYHPRLFTQPFVRRRSTKTSKLRVTGLCEGNSQMTGEFPSQRPVYKAENVSIWRRHHGRTNWPSWWLIDKHFLSIRMLISHLDHAT